MDALNMDEMYGMELHHNYQHHAYALWSRPTFLFLDSSLELFILRAYHAT